MPSPLSRLSAPLNRIRPSATLVMTARVAALKAEGVDVIGLSAGEPDFDTPDFIKEAAIAAIKAGQTRYTLVGGTVELKEAIRAKFKRDNGLDFSLDQVMATVGGKQSLFNALVATLDPGDEVIIPAPYWVSYPDIVAFASGTPIVVPASAAQEYKITPEQIEKAITCRTRWLMLNSPSNPSGAAYSADELKAIGKVVRRYPHVMVMTDDMYEHVWYADFPFSTLAEVCPDLSERILTVNGCSKAYSMTGWRIGFSAGPAWLIKAMTKLQGQSTSNPCSVAQAAAQAGLNGPQDFLAERNIAFRKRRDLVVAMLNKAPGVRCPVPEGAFYVYPDVSDCIGKMTPQGKLVDSDEVLIDYFLDKAQVAAVSGTAFGLSPAFRVSYATSEDILREACTRIQQACSDLKPA